MITLAEGLLKRADLQREVAQLESRLMDNLLVQEGDQASLDPKDIKLQIFKNLSELSALISRINKTNNQTPYNKDMTLMEALNLRDELRKKIDILNSMIERSSIYENRYSITEIKFVNVVDVNKLQIELNDLSRKWRELDTEIQKKNWTTDLLD